jgi:hypothetical protein
MKADKNTTRTIRMSRAVRDDLMRAEEFSLDETIVFDDLEGRMKYASAIIKERETQPKRFVPVPAPYANRFKALANALGDLHDAYSDWTFKMNH